MATKKKKKGCIVNSFLLEEIKTEDTQPKEPKKNKLDKKSSCATHMEDTQVV